MGRRGRVMKQIQHVVAVRSAAHSGPHQQDPAHDFREFVRYDREEVVLTGSHAVAVVVVKNARMLLNPTEPSVLVVEVNSPNDLASAVVTQ